jgi:peptidoglycan hydrolase-like protein with peptidoglycan-binding domain
MPILRSVGAGGANFRNDTFHVQAALDIWSVADKTASIKVDGIVGPRTIAAIRAYQTRKSLFTDGRVDPNGPTIARLESNLLPTAATQLGNTVTDALRKVLHEASGSLLPFQSKASFQRALGLASHLAGQTQENVGIRPAVHLISAFGRPPVVFAAVQAAPVVIVVAEAMMLALLATIAMLILIQMLPTLGKAAEDLIRQIQILMAQLVDGIKSAIESIEDLVRRNTRAGMRCSAELIAFRTLSAQLLAELAAPRSANPIEQEQQVIRISNLFQKWKAAFQAVLDCLAANGAV